MGNAPEIFSFDDNTVTWGEDVIDVSREAYQANPMLQVLRKTAVQYDTVTEDIARSARKMADDARLIQEAVEKGHHILTPSHQDPADLARSIAKRESLAETLTALVWAVKKAEELEEQVPEPTSPKELTGRKFEVTPTKGVDKGKFVTVYGEVLGNHLRTLGMPAEEVQKKLVTVSWLSQGQAVVVSEAGMDAPVLICRVS